MGDIYAGWDRQMDRPVAVKLLRPDLAHLPGMRARVQVEARAAAKLGHPNVVTVLDSGVHDGRPFIVMELLDGRTLADEIALGPFSEDRAREVGEQVLAGLGAAHAAGILHRDVKPGNVLIGGKRLWKVGDFGIAKWSKDEITLTRTGELLGSPSYLAPERLTGSSASPSSDLYSVGVLLYEALAGRRPFEGTDAWSVALAISEGRFAPLRTVRGDADPELCGAIERAMATDPGERFHSAEAMAAALRRQSSLQVTAPTVVRADPTTTLSPVAEEPTARIRPGPTAVLEVPPVTSPPSSRSTPVDPESVNVSPTKRKHATADPHAKGRFVASVVAGALALGLVLVLSFLVGSPPSPSGPNTRSTTAQIPRELDRALDRLQEAVRP